MRAVHDLFRTHYDNLSDRSVYDSEQGIVEIKSDFNDTIPLEFFVLPDEPSAKITTKTDLHKIVTRFLGYRFMINRITYTERSQNTILDNDNPEGFTVKYFCNNTDDVARSASDSEESFFKRNSQHFHFEGPWPDEKVENFPEAFVSHIYYPNRDFAGNERPHLDHVHHLLCHCDTLNDDLDEHELRFSCGQNVKLKHIKACWADLFLAANEDKNSMPFMFLNTCGSGVMSPEGISFPKFFLDNNENRAFIGTEANVPAAFAPEFSKRFYFHLLTGQRLGHAVQRAKWDMITRYGNPLGMLYTLYGNSELKVSKEISKENIEI